MKSLPHIKIFEIRDFLKDENILKGLGFLEILIGGLSLLILLVTCAFGLSTQTNNVFVFVALTGTISTLIGIGLLKFNRLAYELVLYFSSVIILSKVLILADLIQLNGALGTVIPSPLKSWISIFYHGWIIFYLNLSEVKRKFVD